MPDNGRQTHAPPTAGGAGQPSPSVPGGRPSGGVLCPLVALLRPKPRQPVVPGDLGAGGRSSLFSTRSEPGARRLEERDESLMDRLKPREANRLYPLSSVFPKLDTHGAS
jgi:hypothetical protein